MPVAPRSQRLPIIKAAAARGRNALVITALRKPLGTPTLREMAQGKNEVAIMFDDYARGSR